MARQPRTPRQKTTIIEPVDDTDDVVSDAMFAADSEQGSFEALKLMFEQLNTTNATDPLTISVYTRENDGKPWSLLNTMAMNVNEFDAQKAIESVKEDHGDGSYKFIVYVKGRVVRHVPFRIGDPRKKNIIAAAVDNTKEYIPMMMQMMQGSSDRQMQMMQLMMQQSSEASNRTMTAIMGMFGTIVPALVGGKTDPAQMLVQLATIMKELQPSKDGLKEGIETLVAAKSLFSDSGGNGSEDNIFSIIKEVGPTLAPVVQALIEQAKMKGQGNVNGTSITPLPPPAVIPPQTSQVAGIANAEQLASGTDDVHREEGNNQHSLAGNRILKLVGDDIVFFANRGYDVEHAAEIIADKFDENGITQDEIGALLAEASTYGDWIEALATVGYDLRQHRQWIVDVLTALANILNSTDDTDEEDGLTKRTDRSATDTQTNGDTSSSG